MNVTTGKVSLVVPVRNSLAFVKELTVGIQSQTLPIADVIIIDSASDDGSAEQFRKALFSVTTIPVAAFNHGSTRNLGVDLAASADIIVFLTQDTILRDPHSLHRLVAPFVDEDIGIAYGRQVPRGSAGAIEQHARLFNYPKVGSICAFADVTRLGIKAVFNSNSFAAYRREALASVGGFPSQVVMGEDQVVAGRVLLCGWKIAYAADAVAVHSHGYSPVKEFRRYFDIGAFHAAYPFLHRRFGAAIGEGGRFVRSELEFLASKAPYRIPEALLRTALKLLGYKLGFRERLIPPSIKRHLAMHSRYFDDDLQTTTSIAANSSLQS